MMGLDGRPTRAIRGDARETETSIARGARRSPFEVRGGVRASIRFDRLDWI